MRIKSQLKTRSNQKPTTATTHTLELLLGDAGQAEPGAVGDAGEDGLETEKMVTAVALVAEKKLVLAAAGAALFTGDPAVVAVV